MQLQPTGPTRWPFDDGKENIKGGNGRGPRCCTMTLLSLEKEEVLSSPSDDAIHLAPSCLYIFF